jgi:hypothetical protein
VQLSYGDEGGKLNKTRFRVALSGNYGVITKVGENGTERWATNGSVMLGTASRQPRKYILQSLDTNGYWRLARNVFHLRAGFEGALPDLITGEIAQILLEPDLRSVSIEAITENDATQKITIAMEGEQAKRQQTGTVTFFVADDLTVRRVTMRESFPPDAPGIWDERYSEIVMTRGAPVEFFKQTSVTPPIGFTRVNDFDDNVSTVMAPVNNDLPLTPKKKSAPKKAAPPKKAVPKN